MSNIRVQSLNCNGLWQPVHGAAVREVTRETEEEHRKEVWPQRLALVEDGEVLTVNCKQVKCYSNPSATESTLVSVCTVCHSLCDDVVDEFVAGGKSISYHYYCSGI